MTLPSSGTITMQMVATELGVNLPLSLTDSNVRALAGVPSGPISLPSDLYGKSSAVFAASADPAEVGSTNGSTPSTTVSTANGHGSVTYAWTRISGSSNLVPVFPNAATTAFTVVSGVEGFYSAIFRCTATDSDGHTAHADVGVSILIFTGP